MAVFLFVGVLLALITLANMAQHTADTTFSHLFQFILIALNLPALFIGLLLRFMPANFFNQFVEFLPGIDIQKMGMWYAAMGIAGIIVVLPPVRRAIAKVTAIQPKNEVHATALLLAVYLVGNTLSTLGQGGLEALADTVGSANIWQVVGQQLLFVAVGVAGIGIFIRRPKLKTVAHRLGLEKPTLRQLIIGFGIAIILVVVQFMVGIIALLVTPDQIAAIEDVNAVLLADMDSLGEWFLLALSAGVGEEILFRGALQPVFGMPLTVVLFTIAHVQYGFTIITAYFIVLASVLSLIRKKSSTTVAIFVHFSYNFILGIFALLAPILEKMLPDIEAVIGNFLF